MNNIILINLNAEALLFVDLDSVGSLDTAFKNILETLPENCFFRC